MLTKLYFKAARDVVQLGASDAEEEDDGDAGEKIYLEFECSPTDFSRFFETLTMLIFIPGARFRLRRS